MTHEKADMCFKLLKQLFYPIPQVDGKTQVMNNSRTHETLEDGNLKNDDISSTTTFNYFGGKTSYDANKATTYICIMIHINFMHHMQT